MSPPAANSQNNRPDTDTASTYFGFAATDLDSEWHHPASLPGPAAPMVVGSRRARAGKLAALGMAIGLPSFALEAVAQTDTAGADMKVAPDPLGSPSQFLVGQVLSPATDLPAAPAGAGKAGATAKPTTDPKRFVFMAQRR